MRERKLTPEQIIEELRPKLNAIPGVRTYLTESAADPHRRAADAAAVYQYTLQAQDLNELYRVASEFEKRMKEVPGLFDVNSDLQIASPTVKVDIDRDHASAMGVTADKIEDALYDALTASGRCPISTRRPTTIRCCWSCCRTIQLDPGGAASAVCALGHGQAGAAGRGDQAARPPWARWR